MRFDGGRGNLNSLQSEGITEPLSFDVDAAKTCEDFVLQSIAELADSNLGFLHQPPNEVLQLYLVMGGVYRLKASGITRLS